MTSMHTAVLRNEVMLIRFTEILTGTVMPVLLILCGVILSWRIGIFKILFNGKYFKTLKEAASKGGESPVKAMCTALAGTLGVGNIAGVATAITAGGAGAVLWMLIGAVVSMSVKYGEVALAVKYRVCVKDGFRGGAMYTLRNGFSEYIGKKPAHVCGGVFALLCIINSFITGNLVQTNSAAAAMSNVHPALIGGIIAICVLCVGLLGASKISTVTYALIPFLSGVYILMSLSVIIRGFGYIPEVLADILSGAFSLKAAGGGALGFGLREAVRYGITRGIFSNEAGCGTSPTAHASADVESPHHQGCFGIFEVFADTILLCSMTALVILIAQKKYGLYGLDGVPLTLRAFRFALGPAAEWIIAVSVVLFALATVIAQIYYGSVCVGYFTASRTAPKLYVICASAVSLIGTVIDTSSMWVAADVTVGVMTVINVVVLIVMRREIAKLSPYGRG